MSPTSNLARLAKRVDDLIDNRHSFSPTRRQHVARGDGCVLDALKSADGERIELSVSAADLIAEDRAESGS